MQVDELIDLLLTEPDLADAHSAEVTPIAGGLTSPLHVRVRGGRYDLAVKLARNHERDILLRMQPLGLTHVERVLYPRLLQRNVLVTSYDASGPIRDLRLAPTLVAEFAHIQNTLSVPSAHDDKGRAFYGTGAERWARGAVERWRALRTVSPIVDRYEPLIGLIDRARDTLPTAYGGLPFARMHHDFREQNILAGPPQRIVDWGSSYGDGPFLFDLAPFCLGDATTWRVYRENSRICQAASPDQLRTWLWIAALTSLAAMWHYLPERTAHRDRDELLAAHYALYVPLLDQEGLLPMG